MPAKKKKKGGTLVRVNGAYRESIPGIGYTTRDEPFEVEDPETFEALLSQEGRFQKEAPKPPSKRAVPDSDED